MLRENTQLELALKIHQLEKQIKLLTDQLDEYKLMLESKSVIADWEKDLYDWA